LLGCYIAAQHYSCFLGNANKRELLTEGFFSELEATNKGAALRRIVRDLRDKL